jgi:hypothetical protein
VRGVFGHLCLPCRPPILFRPIAATATLGGNARPVFIRLAVAALFLGLWFAAYVIGTRHKEDYQLFVPRELAPDLTALTGQIVRQREDKGSSLRFEAAETYNIRHGLAADAASAKLRAVLEKGREALVAAQAERARLCQVEELRKAQELKHTLKPRGPILGM